MRIYMLLCDKTFLLWHKFSWEMQHMPIHRRRGTHDSRIQIPKTNLMNQWVLLGLITGVWMRHHLQEQKWLKDSCITKATPPWVTDNSQKAGNLERTSQPAGTSTGWRSPFQEPRVVWASSRQLVWYVLLPSSSCSLSLQLYCLLWREGPSESGNFRGFLKLFWVIFLLKELLCRMECYNLRANCCPKGTRYKRILILNTISFPDGTRN